VVRSNFQCSRYVVHFFHGRDHILDLLGRILLGDRRHLFRWYRTTQGVKRHYLLLIGATVLNDALESPRLQLHLHQERPIGVTGLGEGRVASPTA
jgi:hypothetical protein